MTLTNPTYLLGKYKNTEADSQQCILSDDTVADTVM